MGLPSIGTFLGGIGALLGKASTYIPGRTERWKNKVERLREERQDILHGRIEKYEKDEGKKAARLVTIQLDINRLERLLENK